MRPPGPVATVDIIGTPRGADDALAAKVFAPAEIPPLCFDDDEMVAD